MTRTLRIYAASIIVALALAVFAGASTQAFIAAPQDDLEIATTQKEVGKEPLHNSAWPARLTIPSIDVDATVQRTGITRKGNMAVPESYYEVGWYRYGAVPGQQGSAVIGGHIDTGGGTRAVFSRLHELRAGDDVFVLREDGEVLHFVVEGVEEYHYQSVPTERLFSSQNDARLNLITCSGTWLKDVDMYDHRLVVYTRLASPS